MKHKFSSMGRVAIALVLALSLSLVMAVPLAADTPADTDAGFLLGAGGDDTAEWSKTEALPAGGDYSVQLTKTATQGSTYVEFVPAAGTMISDLEALTNDWSFWYFLVDTVPGPQLELLFRSASYDSDTGNGEVYITLMPAQGPVGGDPAEYHAILNTWTEVVVADDLISVNYCGKDLDGDATNFFDGNKDFDTAVDEVITAYDGDWELARVRAEMWEGDARTCYIDDITIDGTLYELEPIFLDKDFYSVGDTVEVTVPNFKANTDPMRVNPVTGDAADTNPDWEVSVTSTSDSEGITVALEETGINTGVFTGSFTTVDTSPGEDELYVQDDNDIIVTYGGADPFSVDWGAGVDTVVTTLTAQVDDTPPTITVDSPKDGTTTPEARPVIKATYEDDPDVSGIDKDSVEMFVDDMEIDDADAVASAASVIYTPTEDLAEGSHDVTVNVSDNAGNEATLRWSFRIASWLEGSPVEDLTPEDGSLDALDTVGVAVSGAGIAEAITVGRYASNPQPEAPPTFEMIENGFFDVQVKAGVGATQIIIKFADDNITADSTAYVWSELDGVWLECSDQYYNPVAKYLRVKVRATDTTPNISELGGTPFAISGVLAVEDPWVYDVNDDDVIDKTEAVAAVWDYFDGDITKDLAIAVVWLYFG